jgi:phage terminase large subunit-like protein
VTQPNQDPKALAELLETLEAISDRKRFRRMDFFVPYPKQKAHLMASASYNERLLMAGNQNGKTITGAFEAACHATGEYPDWWTGRKFDHPTKGWAVGETGVLTRDVSQKYLCGEPGVEDDFGTGMIPKEALLDKSLARGVTDAYDTVQVQHKTNGIPDGVSIIRFKSYEQGRTKMQGDTLDWVWCDEEPPPDIYSEINTRLMAGDNGKGGIGWITFTPLKGRSAVVLRFVDEPSPDRLVTVMTIEDALHISPEDRAKRIAAMPAHEREARAHGVPMLGSGRIFQISEDMIREEPLEHIPAHWFKLWGIDFGIGHPFAAVLILWDKDNDVIHIHHCIRMADGLPINHAAAMKPIGAYVPVAWPQDGTAREKGTGETFATSYKKFPCKLVMLPEHATWEDGGVSTEAGILEMIARMTTGRFKVSAQLSDWFGEFREYHRKDGMIVKVRDDLMSATRIAIMAKRHARLVQLGPEREGARRGREQMARGIDFDVFSI